jgi:diaminopimelate decarboxylase
MADTFLDTIARVVGTPCYVYDLAQIESKFKRLEKHSHLHPLYYAVKANANKLFLPASANATTNSPIQFFS